MDSSSSSSSPDLLPSPLVDLSLPLHNFTHQVFPSFHGPDVRKAFLSHVMKEFRRKGIEPFIDNEIERSKYIRPELIEAIRGSKIAIVLLSKNYASSSWCLDELVEIMSCSKLLGQTVMTVFYEVYPTNVKKQTGDFGKVFQDTCKGKSKEDIGKWRQALAEVAEIAGYHSSNCDTEAAMVEKITTDISNKLNNSTPSNDFDGLVGMGAHMEKMKLLLCLESDEVRMIGIWGPSGIGKTTIARFLFSKHSHDFNLSGFMENIKAFMYTRSIRACSDDHSLKLQLQQQLLSQIFDQKDIVISHLGVAKDRLKDKRVLVVLDDVDLSFQLDAMAKETRWFGPGSRIIITTQDRRLLKAHGIDHIYKVNFPTTKEALQIFCMNAFGQNSPKDGFEKLAREVTYLAGQLPLGLKVIGSHFRGMSKQEWIEALPRLRTHLHSDIQNVLKFSYDALDDEDKELFLHLACFFRGESIDDSLEETLRKKFPYLRQGLRVLAEKSLISIEHGWVEMHNLLEQLGREIVRKQSIDDPGKRQFLVDAKEICEVLTDDTGSTSVLGIDLKLSIEEKIDISERAFKGMSNLQFLRFHTPGSVQFLLPLHLPRGLKYLSRKLRLLHWENFPMKTLPSEFHTEFLVNLVMPFSDLEKLWTGTKPLRNLRWIYLENSFWLKELPDLSTATNLEKLFLSGCSSLVKLPSSIGNATSLVTLNLDFCSELVELPSTIGYLHKLVELTMMGCSKLEALPTNINLESLQILDLTDCSLLSRVPGISTNIELLKIDGTAIEEGTSSIMPRLDRLRMSNCEKFKEFPHSFASITKLCLMGEEIQETPPWMKRFSCLRKLKLKKCRKLVSLAHIPDSLKEIDAKDCESLETLDWSSHNSEFYLLKFRKCFKLNKEARDLLFKTSIHQYAVFPGREVPAYFTDRANGDSVTIKLKERLFRKAFRSKICIFLVNETGYGSPEGLTSTIFNKQNDLTVSCGRRFLSLQNYIVKDHLFIFDDEGEIEVTSTELVFEFKACNDRWQVGKCGVELQLMGTRRR